MKDVEIIKARNVLSSRARTNLTKRLRVAAYCRVSTDSEDQLNSYKSQVQHYTDLIKSKSEWDLAGIYADEAITGTQVTKREDFQRLINDCMNGDVDMIITKSISRFARNTLDTLKYVRMLKEKGIAVFFEEENINTLTMDGELLLVILSSVAQQEVENISANVKKGLKMKMQRGELVGFQGCLGYDYHPEDKSITINEEEAEIVRYIFRRYIEGAGGSVIAHELENLGYRTKRGSTRWAETTVIGIIKNEKYKGDILMGKTFTLDPISKRRLDNFGEEDQFYIRDHHEAIISEEMFEKAQEILKRRAKPRRLGTDGKREKFSRKYAFSCMLECGFCGGTLTRRSWHSGSQYNKTIWQCVTATKKGKKFCPDSKGIAEETIEQAFILCYWTDGKMVYWRYSPVSNDVEHFVWFNNHFAKDSKHCFLQRKKLRNVDHASFTALNNCYARDCKSVWTTGGRFEPEDISSFVVCDDGVNLVEMVRTMSDGTQRPIRVRIPYGYAKDSKAVYYENFAGKIKILKKADPTTFVSNNDGYFAWDAKSIFWGGYLLPKADLQSWRIVNTEMDLSRDDKHFYILNKLVTEEEWNQKLLG